MLYNLRQNCWDTLKMVLIMRYQGQNFCDFEFLWKGNRVQSCSDYFRIPHNTLSLPPKFCINICFQMLLRIFPRAFILKTITYTKFGWKTECIMGNLKIENWVVSNIPVNNDWDCWLMMVIIPLVKAIYFDKHYNKITTYWL